MATPHKKWPHNAEWARQDSVDHADEAWQILNELLDELDNVHHVRQVGRAMSKLQEIKFKLVSCKEKST
jgi:hypothetical protein